MPDWNVHALAATIEAARLQRRFPHPEGLHESYYTNGLEALTRSSLEDLSLTDEPLVVRSALAVIAFGRGQALRGRLLAELTDDEVEAVLEGGAREGRSRRPGVNQDRPPARPPVPGRGGLHGYKVLYF